MDKWTVDEDVVLYPEDYGGNSYMRVDYEDSLYKGRNYFLFHVLANVRGSDEWGPIISEPKGIPENSCKEIKHIVSDWSDDGHSHSYLTLTELLEFDWNAKVQDETTLVEEQVDKFLSKLDPEDLISNESKSLGSRTIHKVNYMIAYKDIFGSFMDTIAKMNGMFMSRLNETSDDIRLVFFFDN